MNLHPRARFLPPCQASTQNPEHTDTSDWVLFPDNSTPWRFFKARQCANAVLPFSRPTMPKNSIAHFDIDAVKARVSACRKLFWLNRGTTTRIENETYLAAPNISGTAWRMFKIIKNFPARRRFNPPSNACS
jgi:hypothetical protein